MRQDSRIRQTKADGTALSFMRQIARCPRTKRVIAKCSQLGDSQLVHSYKMHQPHLTRCTPVDLELVNYRIIVLTDKLDRTSTRIKYNVKNYSKRPQASRADHILSCNAMQNPNIINQSKAAERESKTKTSA
jgi:hypothetical protein